MRNGSMRFPYTSKANTETRCSMDIDDPREAIIAIPGAGWNCENRAGLYRERAVSFWLPPGGRTNFNAGLQNMKDRVARDDADNASTGDHGHLLHADVAHAVEQGKRGLFGRGPVKFFLGQQNGLHRSDIPILLRHRVERLRGHKSD